jgi:hypothetical protein
VLPLAVAILPIAGLGILASAGFERGFLGLATTLGLTSLWHGYRKHRVPNAFQFLLPGLVVISAAIWIPILHDSPAMHGIAMSAGGLLVALSHWTNLRLSKRLLAR